MKGYRIATIHGVLIAAIAITGPITLAAQSGNPPGSPPLPPSPPDFPVIPGLYPPPRTPVNATPKVPIVFQPIPQPKGLPTTRAGVPTVRIASGAAMIAMPTNVFAWEADSKAATLKVGEESTVMSFSFTNVTSSNVVITAVRTSCGCTVPKQLALPWTIAPDTGGQLEFTVDVRGKSGTLTKVATVDTSAGTKHLALRVTIPMPPAVAGGGAMGDRVRNLQIAAADRQAVFRGECAKCHAESSVGKTGESLYGAACGVCHEAEHRASMVPDLKALKNPTDRNYWKQWITIGKPGTLMPAFAKSEGGPLTDDQIASLVDFLDARHSKPSASAQTEPISGATAAAR